MTESDKVRLGKAGTFENDAHCRFCHGRVHLRELDEELPHWWLRFRLVKVTDCARIPVRMIVGSVSNGHEFDPLWTPFVPEERDAQILESMKDLGFDKVESSSSPIVVSTFNAEYFVESDGHRRVAAAHKLHLKTIEAEVYELTPICETNDKGMRARHVNQHKISPVR